jgi:NAD(P)-dependent dehydrogenase (short-subunit alcohol dehydrogenase family)
LPAGARIGLIARDAAALEDVKAEIEALGGDASCAPADVADAEAVFAAADAIEAALGAIDIWINDAMVTVFSPVADITPAEFRRVTEVTYLGFVHGTMAALRHMRPRDRGTIVQVSSALAYRGIPRKDNLTAPVSGLHRTRGSFGAEAAPSAVSLPGRVLRFAMPLAACALAAAVGLAIGRGLAAASAARRTVRAHHARITAGLPRGRP